uniref:THAP-type domain-containing protein n=1 Tax=Echeneis naucrates TaxID=173247 RepID=A0A665U1W1_ECHNA
MANTCSVFGCGEAKRDTSLHLLPKDHTTWEKWLQFIWNDNVPENIPAKTQVCSKHFEDSCFLNLAQKQMGFTTKHDAFPSSLRAFFKHFFLWESSFDKKKKKKKKS